jgi:hypothetical protein
MTLQIALVLVLTVSTYLILCVIIYKQWIVIASLNDRLMSRDYQEFKITQTPSKDWKPKRPARQPETVNAVLGGI